MTSEASTSEDDFEEEKPQVLNYLDAYRKVYGIVEDGHPAEFRGFAVGKLPTPFERKLIYAMLYATDIDLERFFRANEEWKPFVDAIRYYNRTSVPKMRTLIQYEIQRRSRSL